MDESLVVTGAVLCAAGVVSGALAMKAQRGHRRWCEGKARVDGVVSRLVRRPRPGHGHSQPTGVASGREPWGIPVVRFRAANKVEYEVDVREAPRKVGAVVALAYDPALPSGARGIERTPKIGVPVFLLLVGAVLVAAGW